MDTENQTVRLDKWLWAARFFKTRSMAAKAINGGRVHLNGNRVKAAKTVSVNDKLDITIGVVEFHITVLALSKFRRPAKEARLLYIESAESIKAREESRELRRMVHAGYTAPGKRPSKRDRRKIRSFIRKDEQE
ncbi:MAG: RNA-binding S4 domain-containing protein [Desulforhopalus sp.]